MSEVGSAKPSGGPHQKATDGRFSQNAVGQRAVRNEVRTFEVHALGPSGSGKTVFMASLYKRLNIKRRELPFYLRSDYDTGLQLNHTYNQLANPDENWPSPTQRPMEWNFTACLPTSSGDFEAIRYKYLDYPGGLLTSQRNLDDEVIGPLIGRLKAADALLVLLDGQQVMALLRGERSGARYLELEITTSLEIVQQSRCPVHFVVTKWDLLEGRHSLEEVRDRLMRHPDLSDLIEAKRSDTAAAIRLFPVSAVGPGFAALDEPSGQMKKTGSLHPKPENVELPLISVVPDTLQFVYLEAENRGGRAARALSKLRVRLEDLAESGRLQRMSKQVINALIVRLVKRFPQAAIVKFVDFDEHIDDAIEHIVHLARYLDAEHTRQIMSIRDALVDLAFQFTRILAKFEKAEPASVLAGGLADFPLAKRLADAEDPGSQGDAG